MTQTFGTIMLTFLGVVCVSGFGWIAYTTDRCAKDVRRELDSLSVRIAALEAKFEQADES